MKRFIIFLIFLIAGLINIQKEKSYSIKNIIFDIKSVYAEEAEAWKEEFDDICSKTNDAYSLSKEELKSLIERCDKLKPIIEKLDESARKVYLKRLQMCRELFNFMIESNPN